MAHVAYLDDAAVIGTSPAAVKQNTLNINIALRSAGLRTHEISECDGDVEALGVRLRGSEGIISISNKRLGKLEYTIDFISSNPRRQVSGTQIRRPVGHLTFACLFRRETFSCLGSTYHLVTKHDKSRARLWPSVLKEFRWICFILPLIFCDMNADWDICVYVFDASTYGCGVCTAHHPVHCARSHALVKERWRYVHDHDIGSHRARMHALNMNIEGFPEIDCDFIHKHNWQVVCGRRFAKSANILLLEGFACLWVVKHRLRKLSSQGRRCLHLVDNLGLSMLLSKGRSSQPIILHFRRQ